MSSGCLPLRLPPSTSAHLGKTSLLQGWLLTLMRKIQADPTSTWPFCSILNIYLKRNKTQQKALRESRDILKWQNEHQETFYRKHLKQILKILSPAGSPCFPLLSSPPAFESSLFPDPPFYKVTFLPLPFIILLPDPSAFLIIKMKWDSLKGLPTGGWWGKY